MPRFQRRALAARVRAMNRSRSFVDQQNLCLREGGLVKGVTGTGLELLSSVIFERVFAQAFEDTHIK